MSNTLLPLNPSTFYTFSSSKFRSQVYLISHPYRCINTTSIRRRCLSVSRASNDDMEVMKNIVETVPSALPLFLLNLPSWANWLWGALVLLALPFYGRIRRIQDQVEGTIETVAHVVESVAEVTEKASSAVADALPDGDIKKAVLEVEHIAQVVDKSAEAVEGFINKIDEIEADVDSLVNPLIKRKASVGEGEEKI
ncbi:Methyl-accepting chemotaxis protein (MCP) signaling domain-containing protein [Dioscorea alata]|uniref:Methyl-accepting chemotaxis protein (MCP) signaling domain-containing protein n=1 Tax=Dioscorea alata TaxID=55571 RepID=A0ACB7VYJ0_DIOAL|nr:Methyl-accepting chemotaxis protein (MCP) signaling domain-containing protein [Dioscorea alata]